MSDLEVLHAVARVEAKLDEAKRDTDTRIDQIELVQRDHGAKLAEHQSEIDDNRGRLDEHNKLLRDLASSFTSAGLGTVNLAATDSAIPSGGLMGYRTLTQVGWCSSIQAEQL